MNLQKDTTLNVKSYSRNGIQAFNLDLWTVEERSSLLDLNMSVDFVIWASLILYLATEMMIVEDKGKSKLAIKIVN
ncbi:MAG: hypothetical protein N2558_01665 [Patescibacteria group bacterium]|nr:hypothetical protein [Patescibacteria group bacterium]